MVFHLNRFIFYVFIGEGYDEYQPLWFTKAEDPLTGSLFHNFNGTYWDCKERGDWSRCPDIY